LACQHLIFEISDSIHTFLGKRLISFSFGNSFKILL